MSTYLTTREVGAEINTKDVHSVLALIASGKLAAVNISTGKRPTWRIHREALDAFLAGRTTRPAAKPLTRQRKCAAVTKYF